jgi:hypothetical protein
MILDNSCVGKARNLVSYFHNSNIATFRLNNLQTSFHRDTEPLKLISESTSKTRWWSTYTMVERLLHLRPYIDGMVSMKEIPNFFENDNWQELEIISALLEPFMAIQKYMEDDYVTSTSSFLPFFVFKLRELIMKAELAYQPTSTRFHEIFSPVILVQETISQALTLEIKQSFLDRWGSGTVFTENETRGVLVRQIRKGLPLPVMIASSCDPRTKSLLGIPSMDQPRVWEMLHGEMMKSYDLLHTSTKLLDARQQENRVVSTPTSIPPNPNFEFFGELNVAMANLDSAPSGLSDSERRDKVIDSELKAYRDAPILDARADPFQWWSANQVRYPHVAMVAKQFLSIPGTSAGSERVFSIAGRVICANRRAKLKAANVQDFIFLKSSWEKVEEMELVDLTGKRKSR